ncbi:DUF6255 family natural product biosynthesis protein [Streptomyces triculaminicus]|uniref:DUF6255 family natural product biosynthesis protein n=1 Tax=Streptomyces triculaminicus TaxID=2816232 RepID=UPI0037D392E6
MTVFTTGRMRADCRHQAGWTHADGMSTCRRCGVRRFAEYGALRPPGLPQAVPVPPAAVPERYCPGRRCRPAEAVG